MNLVIIDTWTVDPLPSDLICSWNPLVDSGRNADGNMIGDLINTKFKLELVWKSLTPSQMTAIMSRVVNFFVSVTYINPITNTTRSATFYTSPVTYSTFKYSVALGQIEYYNNVRLALIEK